MEFAPLAHYMNGLVAAFNTLRQCCPVATLSGAIKLIQQSLGKVSNQLSIWKIQKYLQSIKAKLMIKKISGENGNMFQCLSLAINIPVWGLKQRRVAVWYQIYINTKVLTFQVISALLELHRLEHSGFTAREVKAFQRMCSVVANDLLPHINKCLRCLYPAQQISLITGIAVNQLQKQVSFKGSELSVYSF